MTKIHYPIIDGVRETPTKQKIRLAKNAKAAEKWRLFLIANPDYHNKQFYGENYKELLNAGKLKKS